MAYYSPEEIAGVLKVKNSTLRKYALLLEGEGITYQKNEQGHRYYSDTDLIALQKFISFKDSGAMTLKESAEAVFLWSKGSDIAELDTSYEAVASDIERYDVLTQESLLNALNEQQGTIEGMAAMIEGQAKQNAFILEELNATRCDIQRLTAQLADKQGKEALEAPTATPKKGLWARLRGK